MSVEEAGDAWNLQNRLRNNLVDVIENPNSKIKIAKLDADEILTGRALNSLDSSGRKDEGRYRLSECSDERMD